MARERTSRRSRRKFDSQALQRRTKKSQQRAKSTGKNVIDSSKDIPMVIMGDGRHVIDIVPYIAGKNDPEPGEWAYTFEYWYHRNIGPGNEPVICLQATFDKACPICEFQQKLRDCGETEEAKKFWPKRRNLYNVICYDKGQREKGIQVLDVSWHYFEKYLAKISEKLNRRTGEPETINFASPNKREGRSIEWTIEPAKGENDYPDWIGHTFDRRDYEISNKDIDATYVLDEIVVIKSYDEIAELMGSEKSSSGGSSRRSSSNDEDDSDQPEDERIDELQDALDRLDDADEIEDAEDIIDELGIEFEVNERAWNRNSGRVKDKLRSIIEGELEELNTDKGEAESGNKYTEDDINDMDADELKSLIKKEKMDIDLEDYDLDNEDDVEDLKDEVKDILDL
jgi:hypothetical protein